MKLRISAAVLSVIVICVLPVVAASSKSKTEVSKPVRLFEFVAKETKWTVVNDGVMGGVSQSSMVSKGGIATFSGRVRLENNGGFASTRSGASVAGVSDGDNAFRLRVKGDGAAYQFTVATDNGWHWAQIMPKRGVWSEIVIPFSSLVPKSRFGETVKRSPFTGSDEVSSIGVLIGNKRDERFTLALDWIEVR